LLSCCSNLTLGSIMLRIDMAPTPLYKKHLTPERENSLKTLRTPNGYTLERAIRSGVENPDSSIGIYAGDAESYEVFAPVLDPVIEDYHSLKLGPVFSADWAFQSEDLVDLKNAKIVSTRVRVGRNLKGFAFTPLISLEKRLEVERLVVAVLQSLEGELAGQYYPLSEMSEETFDQLVQDHFLFKKGDRFLESAGVNRDWPKGRGIFHSKNKDFLVWVNEEDHLRIISMQQGGDVLAVFERLSRAVSKIESALTFAFTERYGFLSSCPTNLGTAMRASVHIDLSAICKQPDFQKRCAELGLSVRGIHGEHSESAAGIYDISNKRRLRITESETLSAVVNGISRLIK